MNSRIQLAARGINTLHARWFDDISASSVLSEPPLIDEELLVAGLEVERGHLDSAQPEGHGVVVGGICPHALEYIHV